MHAAFLELHPDTASAASVTALTAVVLVSQKDGGQDWRCAASERKSYNSELTNWGWAKLVPLADLRDASRGFLKHDRLLLRADITVESVRRKAAAA